MQMHDAISVGVDEGTRIECIGRLVAKMFQLLVERTTESTGTGDEEGIHD